MKDNNKLNKFSKNKKKTTKAIIAIIISAAIFTGILSMMINPKLAEPIILGFLIILLFVLLCVMIYLFIGGFDDER